MLCFFFSQVIQYDSRYKRSLRGRFPTLFDGNSGYSQPDPTIELSYAQCFIDEVDAIDREIHLITKGVSSEEQLLLSLNANDYYAKLKNFAEDNKPNDDE
jgi:hypothetical protein